MAECVGAGVHGVGDLLVDIGRSVLHLASGGAAASVPACVAELGLDQLTGARIFANCPKLPRPDKEEVNCVAKAGAAAKSAAEDAVFSGGDLSAVAGGLPGDLRVVLGRIGELGATGFVGGAEVKRPLAQLLRRGAHDVPNALARRARRRTIATSAEPRAAISATAAVRQFALLCGSRTL